jgi:hypothetical protein
VSSKTSGHEFRPTIEHLLRFGIFLIIFFLVVNFLSSRKQSSLLLPQLNLYQHLPQKSRQQLENISPLPFFSDIETKYFSLQNQVSELPQKQINELKLWLAGWLTSLINQTIKPSP